MERLRRNRTHTAWKRRTCRRSAEGSCTSAAATPWRRPHVVGGEGSVSEQTLRSAFAATAVVVVVACGPAAVAPVSVAPSVADVPPTTAASPTASPTAAPSPTSDLLDTSTWTTYVSKRHGFSIAHPADWSEDPSDHEWTIARDATNHVNTGAEHFSTGGPVDGQGVGVSVWSVPVDPGTTVEFVASGLLQCKRH